ncbi:unnamed protein product [Hydatigera taeniaeformis]|uniref:MFS domain-containing protein n=1 Tax=Hydatigena taeniaeformis TaxID=6205 RepID=A0A0R3WNR3_HYDTA|nr:unnamed protein product [Hydatigera taeniaeformis]
MIKTDLFVGLEATTKQVVFSVDCVLLSTAPVGGLCFVMASSAFPKWMTVVGGFLSYFLADGCTYSAGILFTEFKDIFHAGSTATSLLPALVYAIPQFMSPLICPLTAIVGYSTAAAWGSLFLCISFIDLVTSLAQEIILTYFAYGALLSLGLQLTYTAAFMAVVSTFKDSKWLGLACGVMVCGGGIGAFATNHLLSWILSFWTWREALILQGGIFLHAWISAALFYWLDERATMQSEWEKYESRLGAQDVDTAVGRSSYYDSIYAHRRKPLGDAPELSPVAIQPVCRRVVDRLKSLWYLCPIFMILTPTQHRPRARKCDYMEVQPSEDLRAKTREFWLQLRNSFFCLFSPAVWTNGPFLIYVLTNGLAAAGVVIPWTFVYDYVRTQWVTGLDSAVTFSLIVLKFLTNRFCLFTVLRHFCCFAFFPPTLMYHWRY